MLLSFLASFCIVEGPETPANAGDRLAVFDEAVGIAVTAVPSSLSLQLKEVRLVGVFHKVSGSNCLKSREIYSVEIPFCFASSAHVLWLCGRMQSSK